MTSVQVGQLIGLIITALGTVLAHVRIGRGGGTPPGK